MYTLTTFVFHTLTLLQLLIVNSNPAITIVQM